jgi:starch synthase
MKIAFASSEVFPYAKTGGLADVAGSLPNKLSKLGHDVKIFLPKYKSVGEIEHGLHYVWDIGEIPIRVAGHIHSVHVHKAKLHRSDVDVYFVDCPHYFHRNKIYTNDPDEDERFILFSKGIIEILQRLKWSPDIIHCNDWQTGLLPILLKDNYGWDKLFDKTATVYTIHNIAYQGNFSRESFSKAEIRHEFAVSGGLCEYFGRMNFMKSGILSSDVVNTVSENYARELLTPEYGEGMNNYLLSRKNHFFGILNGIDYEVWNPEKDVFLQHHYSIDDLSGKLENKKFLVDHLGFSIDESLPLIGIVSRLASQKGFDIIGYALNELMDLNAQWIILGSGETRFEEMWKKVKLDYPGKVYFYCGYNNELAHLIEAASDIFLMPSKYEPCGLNQIYSLKYGTVPVVRKTGGLADTVDDWNEYISQGMETGNGYSFYEYTSHALISSVKRAINDYHNKHVWRKIQTNGMQKDFSWHKSAEKYVRLYDKAIQIRRN